MAEILGEGVHSGSVSGMVSAGFCAIQEVFKYLEKVRLGEMPQPSFSEDVPSEGVEAGDMCGQDVGNTVYTKFPWIEDMEPMIPKNGERATNRTRHPAISLVGHEAVK